MKKFLLKIFFLFLFIFFMLYDRINNAMLVINNTSNNDVSGKFFICIFITLSMFIFLKILLEEICIKNNKNILNYFKLLLSKFKLINNKENNIDLFDYFQFKDKNDNNDNNV